MSRINGPQEALELLKGLSTQDQKKLIEQMREKDPLLTALLEQHLVTIEDLKYLTLQMLQSFLRDIDTKDLALALKTSSDELKEFLKTTLPKSLWQEITDVLTGPKRKLSDVQNAQQNLVNILMKKIDKGEIVIDRSGKEEYV